MAGLSNLKNLSQLAKAAQAKKGKEVLSLPIDQVVSKPQVRKRFRNLEELADSLKAEGQQTPIIVSPPRSDGKYVIQKGERRWRACQLAGIATIDAVVNDKEQTALDETAGELVENIQRDDLTPLEIAEALSKFVEAGWKLKDIAKRIGKHISFVSTHLSLLKLPECVRELYDREITTDVETLNILRQLYDLSPERCRAVCAVAINDGISRKQSRELLNDAKRAQKPQESEPSSEHNGAAPAPEPVQSYSDPEAEPDEAPKTRESSSPAQAKSAITPQVAPEQKRAKHKQAAPDWRFVRADEVTIVVNVLVDGESCRGRLLLDRVATVPGMAWVELTEPGQRNTLCVDLAAITLQSIES